MEQKIPFLWKNYSLKNIRLDGAYEKNALDKEVTYLLSFDTDRLLAGFYETAGLDTKGKVRYGGWENMLIGGHTLGHYMTACGQAYLSPNLSGEDKKGLKEILDRLTKGLRECQQALGTGFIFGATMLDKNDIEQQFDMVEQGKSHLIKEAWVPYYTLHKIFEGLVTVAEIAELGSIAELACTIASDLADWVYRRTLGWDEETHKTVLSIEYGGINDCLYDVYLLTGKEEHRIAASMFDEIPLFEKVLHAKCGENVLNNHHANTTIPKFQGAIKRYLVTGEKQFLDYTRSFFDMVCEHHSYITGDNSEWEHFGEDDILDKERTNCNCETCNAYNMLKLAKILYQLTGDTAYMDWFERTHINSILSSQNPESGMTTYFQPMATGYFKVYSTPFESFWCCTGSGMENFTKLGESCFYHKDGAIYITRFMEAGLVDDEGKEILCLEGDLTKTNQLTLSIKQDIAQKLCIRIPGWVGEKTIQVQGAKAAAEVTVCENGKGYLVLGDHFKAGDRLVLAMPISLQAENLPDAKDTYGLLYGPYVLAGLLGKEAMETGKTGVDVTIPTEAVVDSSYTGSEDGSIAVPADVKEYMSELDKHVSIDCSGEMTAFCFKDTEAKLTFVPHYMQHKERFGLYFKYKSK